MKSVVSKISDWLALVGKILYLFAEILILTILFTLSVLLFLKTFPMIFNSQIPFHEKIQAILTLFIVIDLLRVITHSLIERRFRLDILFEALIIVFSRETVGILASANLGADLIPVIAYIGIVVVLTLLWALVKRFELRYLREEKADI